MIKKHAYNITIDELNLTITDIVGICVMEAEPQLEYTFLGRSEYLPARRYPPTMLVEIPSTSMPPELYELMHGDDPYRILTIRVGLNDNEGNSFETTMIGCLMSIGNDYDPEFKKTRLEFVQIRTTDENIQKQNNEFIVKANKLITAYDKAMQILEW